MPIEGTWDHTGDIEADVPEQFREDVRPIEVEAPDGSKVTKWELQVKGMVAKDRLDEFRRNNVALTTKNQELEEAAAAFGTTEADYKRQLQERDTQITGLEEQIQSADPESIEDAVNRRLTHLTIGDVGFSIDKSDAPKIQEHISGLATERDSLAGSLGSAHSKIFELGVRTAVKAAFPRIQGANLDLMEEVCDWFERRSHLDKDTLSIWVEEEDDKSTARVNSKYETASVEEVLKELCAGPKSKAWLRPVEAPGNRPRNPQGPRPGGKKSTVDRYNDFAAQQNAQNATG